jgi:hypothetical protein
VLFACLVAVVVVFVSICSRDILEVTASFFGTIPVKIVHFVPCPPEIRHPRLHTNKFKVMGWTQGQKSLSCTMPKRRAVCVIS